MTLNMQVGVGKINARAKEIMPLSWFVVGAFFWGWIYYLVFPVMVADVYIRNSFPLYRDVQSLVISIDWPRYWAFCFGILLSFLIGISLAVKIPLVKTNLHVAGQRKIHPIFFLFILAVQLFCYFLARNFLFGGYFALDWNEGNPIKYFISGLNITLAVMSLYNYHVSGRYSHLDWVPLALNSVVLLGLGGRMYVLVAMIAVMVYMTYFGKWKLKATFLFSVLCAALMILVGVLRSGNERSFEKAIYILSGEAVINWIGGANFIVTNQIDNFESPAGMLASMAIFVPSILWPGKSKFLGSISSDFQIDNPLGGTHILINLLSNFGYAGSLTFVLLMGILSGLFAKICRRNKAYMPFFCMHVALLSFMFFRDSLSIYQKCLIVNTIALPYLMILISHSLPKISIKSSGKA